jgi:hypothetical protein
MGRLTPRLNAESSPKVATDCLMNAVALWARSVNETVEFCAWLNPKLSKLLSVNAAVEVMGNVTALNAASTKAAVSVGVRLPAWVNAATVLIVMVAAELRKKTAAS